MGIIKECDIKLNNYDYIMFVDASGDDGIIFSEGASTKTYVVACFVIDANSTERYNQRTDDLKRIVGANPMHEVKSTTILKHKKRPEIMSYISKLDGNLYANIAFKEKLVISGGLDHNAICNKFFSAACHVFPIKTFSCYYTGSRMLVLIDNMKKLEEENVQLILEPESLDFCFIDSKSQKYRAIQFADIFAGILREFSMEYLNKNEYQRCCICMRKGNSTRMCKTPSSLRPEKMDGVLAISGLLDIGRKECISIEPKSMGPGFNAIMCPKYPLAKNKKNKK